MDELLTAVAASPDALPSRHASIYPKVLYALAYLHSTLVMQQQQGLASHTVHVSDYLVGPSSVGNRNVSYISKQTLD